MNSLEDIEIIRPPHCSEALKLLLASNLYLALGGASLAVAAMAMSGEGISISASLWVLSHLLAVYNLHGLMTFKQGQLFDLTMRSYYRSKHHKTILGGSLTLSFLLILFSPSWLWLPLLGLNLLALFYGTPFLKLGGKAQRPKDLPLLKAPLVTLGVGCSVLLLPRGWSQGESELALAPEHLVLLVHIFLNVIGGDLRDLKLDRKAGIKTWPVKWGFEKVRLFVIFFGLASTCLGLYFKVDGVLIALLIFDVALFTSLREEQKKGDYHFLDLAHFLPVFFILATQPVNWKL